MSNPPHNSSRYATVAKKAVDFIRSDVAKSWSLWTWVCIGGCGTSLLVLKTSNIFTPTGSLRIRDLVALCVLSLCFLAGVGALTCKGTSRVASVMVLVLTIVLGRDELLLGFGVTAVEIPYVVLIAVLKLLSRFMGR